MNKERVLEIATINLRSHEDPNVNFSMSPEFLRKTKKKVYILEGEKKYVVGKTTR